MNIVKTLDKDTLQILQYLTSMKNPEIKFFKPKNYIWNKKKWDIIILIRDNIEIPQRRHNTNSRKKT